MSSRAARAGANPDVVFQAFYEGTTQTQITTSGTSQQSAAFAAKVTLIRVFCTKDCYITFGSNPTATSSKMWLPGGFIEYFGVQSGQKLAVIQATEAGVLHITEGAA